MIRTVFFGTSSFGLPSLQALAASPEFSVVGVVSQPDRASGRGQVVQPSPISALALASGWPLFRWPSLKTPEVVDSIRALEPNLFVVAAYGLLIPSTLLELVPQRALNIHGSLLPKYRGASPIAAGLMAGDTETGVSFMVMTPRLDDGPVFFRLPVPLHGQERAGALGKVLSEQAAQHLPTQIISYLQNPQLAQPQTGPVSYAPKLTRDDGHCVWQDAIQEERRTRAYNPWPGCWSILHGDRIKFHSATVRPETSDSRPGTIIQCQNPAGWGVACAHGIFQPTELQLPGRRTMPVDQFQLPTEWLGEVLG